MASTSGYDDAGSSDFGRSKLGPRDLPSKRLLGTGLASVGYETEFDGKKCARKDFMGVPSSTFRREAARLVGLEDHINVVKTLAWTENKRSCSLVVEYMDDDLLGFLQKRKQSQGSLKTGPSSENQSDLDSRNTIKLAPFELPEALDLMLQIARGMEYLADEGIRHGNLKTKNILVTRTNDRDRNSLSVKVSDFGLVRTRRKSTSFASRQARKLDMARWTAPEILEVFLLEDKGETSSESDSDEDCVDSSDLPEWKELGADVYSFSVICFQILTGKDPYPYPNLNWKELGVNIVRRDGLTPALPAACPPVLRRLLIFSWGFDHERPSFSHFRRTLEGLLKTPLPKKVLMETKREGQLREFTVDLRKPLSVELLWGDELQHFRRYLGLLQVPVRDVARLITRTRKVLRRREEWTQMREELELMLPDMLRIRNLMVGCDKTRGVERAEGCWWTTRTASWLAELISVVQDTLREVVKYQEYYRSDDRQEYDRSLLPSLSSVFTAFTESWRVSKLRHDIHQLAKQRKKIKLDLAKTLRQRQIQVWRKRVQS